MAKTIEYLAGARADFDESFDWYRERSVGAAIGFASAVEEALDSIIADAGRFPSTHAGCRFCTLKRYPFRLVFRSRMPNDVPDTGVVAPEGSGRNLFSPPSKTRNR
jgi:plasmid stabilization system protein ParE